MDVLVIGYNETNKSSLSVGSTEGAREEYVLEVIDPAATAYKSFNMSRKRKVLLGTIAGSLLAVFGVLALVLTRSMLHTLISYRQQVSQGESDNRIINSNGDF